MSDAPVEKVNKRANKKARESDTVTTRGSSEAMGGTTDPVKQGTVKWSSYDSFFDFHQWL
jgi:hypothetical protein